MPGRPARLCLPKEPPGFYGPYADAYRSAWERAVERLERLGLPVEYIDTAVFSQAAAILYEGPWVAERWADLGGFIEANPGTAFPVTEQILRSGAAAQYDAASVFQAMHQLQAYKHEARRLLEDAVLVMPTAGGTWTREQVRQEPVAANRDMGRYTNHCNLLDLCAVAIPAGEAAEQTPFGITMFALAENEGLICGAAQAFGGIAGEDRAARESAASSLSSVCSAEGGTAAAYESPAAVSAGQETSPFAVCATSVAPPADQGSSPSAACALSAAASASQELSSEAHRGEPAALGQPDTSVTAASQADEPAKPETTLVAVCGLHMRGFPLEKQILGCGAVFVKETESAPKYKLVKLATVPAKPGMIKLTSGGAAVQLELWEMPLASFGAFAASIPSPLGIGKVELADGTEVPGFVCEAYAAAQSEDITSYGGWRQAVSVSNV
ncbi:amidase family protein [Paenibacillus sp. TAB 01]|uniref:allophanate hydrolase-related protein n=1 Tax=Paenibacillus sp. TAB 01 TaxID=3368988 RepID=UPI0037530CB4